VIGNGAAEVEESVLVDGRGLEDRHVDVDEAAVVVRGLAEVHWNMMAASAVVHFAFEAGEIPGEVSAMGADGIGFDRGTRSQRETSADLDAAKLADARSERLVEQIRLTDAEAVIEPVAGLDDRGRLIGRDRLALEFSSE
jgi:hypothetical protein